MKAFAQLYEALDSTTSTNEKVAAMVRYFKNTPAADAAWAVFFLSGRRLKRLISSRQLTAWFLEFSDISAWLFKECYMAVGDTAETIALLNDGLDLSTGDLDERHSLADWMELQIKKLVLLDEAAQKEQVFGWWQRFGQLEVFMLNKLLTGAFRVGVSQKLMMRAVAEAAGLDENVIAHRLMGLWEPNAAFYLGLVSTETTMADISKPYPFFLAYPLEQIPSQLGDIRDWQIEWKWDGIRAQCVQREGETFFWSRGEELLLGRFPELESTALNLPDGTVLDGEILIHDSENVLPFSVLQTRIGRQKLTPKILQEAPAAFMVYDLLEEAGEDIREKPLQYRRERLVEMIPPLGYPFLLSPLAPVKTWEQAEALRQESRQRRVEGFMLKRKSSIYQSGRKKGDWWKWKIDPYTIDAVLIYAQAGTGRRANFFTDYTFAVWQENTLVPIAKAYSGLSNEEIQLLDRWIRNNTQDKFGPVRSVTPFHVFELAFEGISVSKRHKSGVAVRFPRILRWRLDKTIEDADTLETLKGLIDV